MSHFTLLLLLTGLLGCASSKSVVDEKLVSNNESSQITTAPIVEKPFYNKAGKKTDHNEFYIQQSVQDYFIKFCESSVTREQLEAALSKVESPIKTLTLKIEIRDGEWDRCENHPVQSRTGEYAVILSIE